VSYHWNKSNYKAGQRAGYAGAINTINEYEAQLEGYQHKEKWPV